VSDEIQDHSLPLRAITLIEQRNGDDYSFLGARLLKNGDLILEGQDIGETPERFFSLTVGNLMHGVWIVELIEVMVITVAAAVAFCTINDFVPYKLMWLGYGLLVLLITRHVWIEDLAFMRASLNSIYLALFSPSQRNDCVCLPR